MTRAQHGFTLIEAVIVLVITGIIAAVVAVFIRAPVQGYFDSARRAEMSDAADTALRRITRDLHLALPNSVRVTNDNLAIEFLQTRTGGRYRIGPDNAGAGDPLDFTQNDASFDIIGPAVTFAAGDQIVIYNLPPGTTGADAYAGNIGATHNRRAYNGTAGAQTSVGITPATPFPFDSPGHRFFVVDTPVTYRCNNGELTRYWGYPITPAQAAPPGGGQSALLVQNVSNCIFNYVQGVTERSGLVAIHLSLTQGGETVSLHQEVHVNNVP
jgi:MSHA biogenesis protein MshO